jgi:hypothetical protein
MFALYEIMFDDEGRPDLVVLDKSSANDLYRIIDDNMDWSQNISRPSVYVGEYTGTHLGFWMLMRRVKHG